jgi:MFS family permease
LTEPLPGPSSGPAGEPVPGVAALEPEKSAWLRRHPRAWLKERNFSRGYWVFFTAAFFYDTGLSVYIFLFNLYLLDLGFNERAMGWIGGAFTLGGVVGTLPSGAAARRFGVQPLLVTLFIGTPALLAARAACVWEPAQIGLGFLTGVAMSIWAVCFMPTVARLTTGNNRTAGFSLIFSVSVGSGMVSGIVCGYLRQWLAQAGIALEPGVVKRLILLIASAVVLGGLAPALRLRVPEPTAAEQDVTGWRHWKLDPFLKRFLPLMVLWGGVQAAFIPFAVVYLERNMRVSMAHIGILFTSVQLLQLLMGLLTPYLFGKFGLVNGIAAALMSSALLLASLALARGQGPAIALYLAFTVVQWSSSPGIFNLLMEREPDARRSTAAAMWLFTNSLSGAAATPLAGALFTRFGYPPVLLGLAATTVGTAMLFRFLMPVKQ